MTGRGHRVSDPGKVPQDTSWFQGKRNKHKVKQRGITKLQAWLLVREKLSEYHGCQQKHLESQLMFCVAIRQIGRKGGRERG